MSEIYCLYASLRVNGEVLHGGTANMKTREGYAMIAFTSSALARDFLAMTGLRDHLVIPVTNLGNQPYPVKPNPEIPLPKPELKIVFPSEEILMNWRHDREGFETAPYVSEFTADQG